MRDCLQAVCNKAAGSKAMNGGFYAINMQTAARKIFAGGGF